MTLSALIGKRGPEKAANDNPAKVANDGAPGEQPLAGLATLALATPTSPKITSTPDPAADAPPQRVLAMLAANPNILRAVVVDNADSDPVLVTVGIRDLATFAIAIPAKRFDAFKLLDRIDRHGGSTVH